MSLVIENFSTSGSNPDARSAVIRTLLYFNIFNHPLTEKEIFNLLQQKEIVESGIESALESLIHDGIIQFHQGYYFLNNTSNIIQRRIDGESNAAKSFAIAKKYSKLIAKFPFVRSIALSGSLSKKFMDSKSDIDYFIITAPGRMWIARTLLVLYKKLFLFNSHKYFCVNYFLTENALEVPDKNIFTATEISFLIPTYNYEIYRNFREANEWSDDYLPNFPLRQKEFLIDEKKNGLKKVLEKIMSGYIGEKLDEYYFRLTLKFWKKKFKHFDDSTFDFRLRSRKNVSKHHPLGYQEKVLTSYSENITSFTRAHHISLHAEDPVYA
ncbi:MAG: nucleotidyltransferase domain-containing protein [Bacteroidota bacterium]